MNKEKMHMIIRRSDYTVRYLCNQAIFTTPRKTTENWKLVTCKNCLKQRPRKTTSRRIKR